jgi:hypothetical protein
MKGGMYQISRGSKAWDDVLRAELQLHALVGRGHLVGHVLARQQRQRVGEAIFISMFHARARTSSAPRKM